MSVGVFAQGETKSMKLEPAGRNPQFTWISKTTHDFGAVPQGKPVTTTFEFKNSGKADLILTSVKASCGCTSPKYSTEPVPAGKKGFIEVTYNAANPGMFNKSVTITSNVSDDPVILTITGEVKPGTTETPSTVVH